jgi:hypothetical protein
VLPAIFALEGARILTETAALASLLRRGALGPWALIRVHVIAYAVSIVAPAGRASAEALKAAMLAPTIGAGRAAAVGVTHQAVSLVAIGIISAPCAIACAWVPSGGVLATFAALHGVAAIGLGFALAFAVRHPRMLGWLARRTKISEAHFSSFRDQLSARAALPATALAWKCLYRLIQVLQSALALWAVGAAAGLGPSLRVLAANLVGAAAGDAIPAQLGATEGAFTAWAPVLGLGAEAALAIALSTHLIQLAWTAIGAALPLFSPRRSMVGAHSV